MTYTLILTDKNPVNNQIVKCNTGKEASFLKKQAEKMGFKVEIKGVKNEQNTPTVKEQQT